MIKALELDLFLEQAQGYIIIDVRSPGEYLQGHIPKAINLPLLNDIHRAIVGTIYKNEGNEKAVIVGFELVGPLFSKFIEEALKIAPNKKLFVHCWRGGLRSNIMAWVLQSAGFEIHLLNGGYKAYRHWVLDTFNHSKNITILGGLTGSGKTDLLRQLKDAGEQTIDLEYLANHKGSAFGGLGMLPPPTNEQFENDLALLWTKINPDKTLWLEDESQNIGRIKIPDHIFRMMRQARVVKVNIPFDIRVNRLVDEYTIFPIEDLKARTLKIAKRLGNLRLNQSLEFLENNDMKRWVLMMLQYYDKAYLFGLEKRDPSSITCLDLEALDSRLDVQRILDSVKSLA